MGKINNREKYKFSRETIKVVFNIIIVTFTLIANGFLSFLGLDFDWSTIATAEYWISYFFNLLSGLIVYFSLKSIRNIQNYNSENIINKKQEITNSRKTINDKNKIREAKFWLREYYNYQTKLNKYLDYINRKIEYLDLDKPFESDKNYTKKIIRYNNNLKLEKYYMQQKAFIEKDNERLQLIIKKNKTEADNLKINELLEELKSSDYNFKNKKIKIEIVTLDVLLSETIEEEGVRKSTVRFNEAKENAKEMPSLILVGAITTAIINSIIPFIKKGFNLLAIFSFLLTIIYLVVFAIRGVISSDKLIKGKYYKTICNRCDILNEMLNDLDCLDIEDEYEYIEIEEDLENEQNKVIVVKDDKDNVSLQDNITNGLETLKND